MSLFLDFVIAFQRALKASQLYGPAHPRHGKALAELGDTFQRLHGGRAQVQLATKNGRIFVDSQMEDPDNLQVKTLAGELEERDVHAIVFVPEPSPQEWRGLLEVLGQKPTQLRAAGGARLILESRGVRNIQILATRLEEVSVTGEFLEPESRIELDRPAAPSPSEPPELPEPEPQEALLPPPASPRPPRAPAAPGPAMPALLVRRETAAQEAQAQSLPVLARLQVLLGTLVAEGLPEADLSTLGDTLESCGLDRMAAQPMAQGLISQAVAALEPGARVALLRGAAALRPGPQRTLFSRLCGTLGPGSLASALAQGGLSYLQFTEGAAVLRALAPQPAQWMERVQEALRQEGMPEEQLADLMASLVWDDLPPEARLERLLRGDAAFEMPEAKVMGFLRQLLESGRIPAFLRLLGHLATGLAPSASFPRRHAAAQILAKAASWAESPGMPTGVMETLADLLAKAYAREADPDVHDRLGEGLERLFWHWIEGGEAERVQVFLASLQQSAVGRDADWRLRALEGLRERLGSPERLARVLAQGTAFNPQIAQVRLQPYLRILGPSAAPLLLDRLWDEPSREARRRLLEALRTCHPTEEADLLEHLTSLDGPTVRNALLLLAEVAPPSRATDLAPFVEQPDAPVALAAIRALGRLGGPEAEAVLVPLLRARDPLRRLEAIHALGEARAVGAVPALLALLKKLKGDEDPAQEPLKLRLLEVLGSLGSPEAVPVLSEFLARHRRFFRMRQEPLPVREAALRALARIERPEAEAALKAILDPEPPGPDRERLQALRAELRDRSLRVR